MIILTLDQGFGPQPCELAAAPVLFEALVADVTAHPERYGVMWWQSSPVETVAAGTMLRARTGQRIYCADDQGRTIVYRANVSSR